MRNPQAKLLISQLKNSTENAVWFLDPTEEYKGDFASDRPRKVIITLMLTNEAQFIHTKSEKFAGEKAYPDKVIIKESERGAYGIGRKLKKNIASFLL
ncbi:hypothetical protein [Nostoc sp.]|uniref:hypothetical protein n=1 Tax=Nostoc sp. TaxID=1180 RepID=UPI002FF79A1B